MRRAANGSATTTAMEAVGKAAGAVTLSEEANEVPIGL
jgi:hypothetical protein